MTVALILPCEMLAGLQSARGSVMKLPGAGSVLCCECGGQSIDGEDLDTDSVSAQAGEEDGGLSGVTDALIRRAWGPWGSRSRV